jgi:hypothetical protein
LKEHAEKTLALEREDFIGLERIEMTFFAVRNWIRKINCNRIDKSTFRKALSVMVKKHGGKEICTTLKLNYYK